MKLLVVNKGRVRHRKSRYIHLIHENDERRQTEKLKNYKKFQINVEHQIIEHKNNNNHKNGM